MSERISNLLIVILLIIALVLGYFIYKKNFSSSYSSKTTTSKVPSSSKNNKSLNLAPRRPMPIGLTEDEKTLLNPPGSNGTQEERDKHFALVVKLAKEAKVLDLNKCEKPNPLALKLNKGQKFNVYNGNLQNHTIWFDADRKYKIPANSTTTLTADFGDGPGYYGYLCDNVSGVVGFFLINP